MSTRSDSISPVDELPNTDDEMLTTERLANAAHSVIDDTASRAQGVEKELREKAEKAGQKLEASQEAATEKVERSLAKAEAFVNERPVAAAGIAFAAGVLATALLRR